MNEHQKVGHVVLAVEKRQYTVDLGITLVDLNFQHTCLGCFSHKMADAALWLVRSPVNQTPGGSEFTSDFFSFFKSLWEKCMGKYF